MRHRCRRRRIDRSASGRAAVDAGGAGAILIAGAVRRAFSVGPRPLPLPAALAAANAEVDRQRRPELRRVIVVEGCPRALWRVCVGLLRPYVVRPP